MQPIRLRPIIDVSNVNAWTSATEIRLAAGQGGDLHVMLEAGGKRYVPAAGATLTVVIRQIDDAKILTKVATQPFTGDASIWSFPVTTNELNALGSGTFTFDFTLTESTRTARGRVPAALLVEVAHG